MDVTRGQRGRVLGLALTLMLLIALPAAASSLRSGRGDVAGRTVLEVMGRAERSSREFPTPGPPGLQHAPSTASGGLSVFECLGTVSHASIDNNFTAVFERALRECRDGAQS
jgi:hypothetical protein